MIYLVRHDQVNAKGQCYGQSDLEAAVDYTTSAEKLLCQLPASPDYIVTSPLKRCAQLALACFPQQHININDELKELNFGDWELKRWGDIERSQIDQWSATPTNFQFPNGESLAQFDQRVQQMYHALQQQTGDCCVFTHAGVIRRMLALHADEPWQDWLQQPVPFASVTPLA